MWQGFSFYFVLFFIALFCAVIIFLLSYPSINLKIKYKNKYTAAITSSLWSYSIRVSIGYLFESLHGILLSILRHFTCRSTSQNVWQSPSFTAACISVSSKLFSWVFLSRIIVFVLRQRNKKIQLKKISLRKQMKQTTDFTSSLRHFFFFKRLRSHGGYLQFSSAIHNTQREEAPQPHQHSTRQSLTASISFPCHLKETISHVKFS